MRLSENSKYHILRMRIDREQTELQLACFLDSSVLLVIFKGNKNTLIRAVSYLFFDECLRTRHNRCIHFI